MKASLKIASLFFLLILLLPSILHAQESNSTTGSQEAITLTPEERAWLAEHPDIQLGYTDAFEPEVIVNPDGTHRGILVDILDELNRRLVTRIGLRIYPVPELVDKAQQQEVDGILSLHPGYADELGLLKTRSFLTNYPAVFARKDVAFSSPSDLVGKRVAIIDKVFFSEQLVLQHGKGATILKVQDSEEGLQLIDNGQADFFLSATLNAYLLTKYQLLNLATQYVFYNNPINAVIGTRSDWPELSSILDKGLSSFSKEEIEAIVGKWVQLPVQKDAIQLTAAEQAWLAQDHTVRVRVTSAPPHIILDEDEPKGISVDYLRLISERTGINFVFTKETRAYTDAMEGLAKLQGPDLIPCTVRDPERDDVLFSKSYSSSPQVIIMQTDSVFISGIDDLRGKILAAPRGGPVSKQVSERYKEITLKLVDWERDALSVVSTGQADAYIGDLTLASYLMLEGGFSNLKVAAPAPLIPLSLCFGSRHDWPELTSIIDKALDNITPGERSAIQSRYLSVHYDYGIKPTDVLKWVLGVGGFAICVVILFILWNRILNQTVKERTATLAKSEKRFRATFEQAAVGIAHFSPEGRFLRINQKFCDIVGYSHQEMLALTFQDLTYPDDLETDVEHIKELLSGESNTYVMEKRYIRKNGELVWIHLTVSLVRDEKGEPQWFVSIVKEITARKKAEEELRKSEHEKALVLDNTNELIAFHDTDHNIQWANEEYLKATGLSLSELKGQKCYHAWGLDRLCTNCPVTKTIEAGEHQEAELTPQNQEHWPSDQGSWMVRAATVRDDTGSIIGAIEVAFDITERKRIEEEVQQLRSEYTHIARVSAMGELVASLAHELKQPLAAMRSNAQAAQRFLAFDKPDIDELHEILKDIIKDNRRADDVIKKLRALMQKSELHITRLDINEVIRDILPLVNSYEIVRNISLKLELGENIPYVNGDRIQLQQVVLNLILNSSEALMNAGQKSSSIVVQTNQEDKDNVTVSVTDNGPGIGDIVMSRLFEPFYTTKKEGLGMGLSISQTIIDGHKGRLWAENNQDRGATFYFTIPIARENQV